MTHPTPEPADLELVLDAAQEWADEYGGWDSVRCDAVTAAAKRIRALSAPPAPSRTADLTATMAGVLFRPGHRIAIISAETGEVLTWRRLGDATIGPATALHFAGGCDAQPRIGHRRGGREIDCIIQGRCRKFSQSLLRRLAINRYFASE